MNIIRKLKLYIDGSIEPKIKELLLENEEELIYTKINDYYIFSIYKTFENFEDNVLNKNLNNYQKYNNEKNISFYIHNNNEKYKNITYAINISEIKEENLINTIAKETFKINKKENIFKIEVIPESIYNLPNKEIYQFLLDYQNSMKKDIKSIRTNRKNNVFDNITYKNVNKLLEENNLPNLSDYNYEKYDYKHYVLNLFCNSCKKISLFKYKGYFEKNCEDLKKCTHCNKESHFSEKSHDNYFLFYNKNKDRTSYSVKEISESFIFLKNNKGLSIKKLNVNSNNFHFNKFDRISLLFKNLIYVKNKCIDIRHNHFIYNNDILKNEKIFPLMFLIENNLIKKHLSKEKLNGNFQTMVSLIDKELSKLSSPYIFNVVAKNYGKTIEPKYFDDFNLFYNLDWRKKFKLIENKELSSTDALKLYTEGKKPSNILKKIVLNKEISYQIKSLSISIFNLFDDVNNSNRFLKQILFNHEEYSSHININDISMYSSYIGIIKKVFSQKSLYSYFKDKDLFLNIINSNRYECSLIFDSKRLFEIINKHLNLPKIRKHFKNMTFKIKDFHDELTYINNNIEEEEKFIKYDDKIQKNLNIKGKFEETNYEFKLPDSNKELKQYGKELNHCVGSYFNGIIEKKYLILSLYIEDKLRYAIELNYKGEILQCKTNHNRRVVEDKENIEYKVIKNFCENNHITYREHMNDKDLKEDMNKNILCDKSTIHSFKNLKVQKIFDKNIQEIINKPRNNEVEEERIGIIANNRLWDIDENGVEIPF